MFDQDILISANNMLIQAFLSKHSQQLNNYLQLNLFRPILNVHVVEK